MGGGGLRGDSQTLGFQTLGLRGSESTFTERFRALRRDLLLTRSTFDESTFSEIYF